VSKQYNELRKLVKVCCDQSAAADKAAMLAARRSEKVLSAIENLRGRVATLEALVRQSLRNASGRPQR